VAAGQATPEETAWIERHVQSCGPCHEELGELRRLGPVESWTRAAGGPSILPEPLWRAISLAESPSLVRLKVFLKSGLDRAMDAGSAIAGAWGVGRRNIESRSGSRGSSGSPGAREPSWLLVEQGRIQLVSIAALPVRGGVAPAAGGSGWEAVGSNASDRALATSGSSQALIRRSPGRLTIVMTSGGAPAASRVVRLIGPEMNASLMTDSSGVAAFRDLPAGEYSLELEDFEG
jgi:hypothetical protein